MAAFMAPKHFVGRASLREVERTDDADDNDELDRLAAPEYRFSRVSGRSEAGDPDAWAPGVPQSEALLQAQLAQELMQAANVRLAQAAQACSQADRRCAYLEGSSARVWVCGNDWATARHSGGGNVTAGGLRLVEA